MHDHIWLGTGYRRHDAASTERIGNCRLTSRLTYRIGLRRTAGQTDHRVAGRYQPWHEATSDSAGGTCNENTHGQRRLRPLPLRDGARMREGLESRC